MNLIKLGPLDVLLKPMQVNQFLAALERAKTNEETHTKSQVNGGISLQAINSSSKKRIILKTIDTIYAVNENDILYCKSDGNYTTFNLIDGDRIMVSKPLRVITELVSTHSFVRCHQSYLVNINHVNKYKRNGVLILNNKIKVPVSSRRKDTTLEIIFGK